VEKLKQQVQTEHDELTDLQNKLLTTSEEKERADKAEAELAKLKKQVEVEHAEANP
jgi:hypothetical protein